MLRVEVMVRGRSTFRAEVRHRARATIGICARGRVRISFREGVAVNLGTALRSRSGLRLWY